MTDSGHHLQTMGYSGLALRTGLSVRTLKRLVADGKVPHIRYGSHSVRFDREAIEEWIAEKTVKPQPQESP